MKRVIFVCGTARCGTTLLDLVLGNDPRGFSLGEVVGWFRPWRTHHFDIKCGCGIYPCPLWDQFKDCAEGELALELLDRLKLEFLVDSSKSLPWVIDQNRRLRQHKDIRVLNLFLFKDPVALYYSHWKRGDRCIERIPRLYQYYDHALQANLPFVAVSYDWFVREPSRALEKICGILEIPFFHGKQEFWRKQHHHLFGSYGARRQLASGERQQIYIEEFSPEFAKEARAFEMWFRQRADVERVMRALQARDIRNIHTYPGLDGSRIRRPPFYYREKLRNLYRGFFPERYPDKEASLIREWRL